MEGAAAVDVLIIGIVQHRSDHLIASIRGQACIVLTVALPEALFASECRAEVLDHHSSPLKHHFSSEPNAVVFNYAE